MPPAVFTALIVPPLLIAEGPAGPTLRVGPALVAGLVGAFVAWRRSNLVFTIGAGMLTFWFLRWLGL